MEIDGEERPVSPGDAILIPPGAWHQITASQTLRFLCCCAPPYSHEDTFLANSQVPERRRVSGHHGEMLLRLV
jgi:mannose-6-phosphate isomerase-like protein (cupin superfamily)